MLAVDFFNQGEEVPAMPAACLQPDGAHGKCADEKQTVNYRSKTAAWEWLDLWV